VDIGVKNGRIVGVRGRAVDRVNKGRLGPKGLNGWEANNSPDRLTKPLIRRGKHFEEASWEEAMSLIVEKSKALIEKYTSGTIGIYNTGQLFIEDYYTLAVIAKAGLGTPHTDGNTRLCTATAAAALEESFGTDGQPGSYTDVDVADTFFLIGHNPAATQTVQWMRILDRRRGPDPTKMIVVDPRTTATAREADLHLRPKLGTNLALMNGLLQVVIANGDIDQEYIEGHTQGFANLVDVMNQYPPERVEAITGVPAEQIEEAGAILGSAKRLVSTVLQGVYQSNQATEAAVAVNNLHLIRGMIGKPGCTVFQMNGQPTAQNTRETGPDGDLTGFRNWQNPKHVQELAKLWNVEASKIPSWAPPTHIMSMMRLIEEGSMRMLWVICTNPAVSLPELERVRRLLAKEDLFLIVQDAFMTETAALADVVLPTAIWGEKTGTFTNADRTVHLSLKAVEPPGEARPDMDIFLDYSRRMNFLDKDGEPLIKWTTSEGAFEAFKAATAGRPCDYTGITYAKLKGGSGIQWPCNAQFPDGKERLYENGEFNTDPDYCERWGHDVRTGAEYSEDEYRAMVHPGKAWIKSAHYEPPSEEPSSAYPFWLSTGRIVHHFHTRTKTGRSKELCAAAPESFVQLSAEDASKLGVREGDILEVESKRGKAQGPARIGDILPGHVFVPFHFGYWDDNGERRAANELTLSSWDPISKQPHFKYAAVKVRKVKP
jgi:anaerobic selenocysteine-containing dehydrogenase